MKTAKINYFDQKKKKIFFRGIINSYCEGNVRSCYGKRARRLKSCRKKQKKSFNI